MKGTTGISRRTRIVIALSLAGAAIILAIVFISYAPGRGAEPPSRKMAGNQRSEDGQFARGVEAVCAEFKVPPNAIRSRQIKDGKGNALRTEYRLRLPKDFSSAEFNQALNRKVEPWGARVVGTERMRDHTVTLHVIREDATVLSVILEMNESTRAGKDHGH